MVGSGLLADIPPEPEGISAVLVVVLVIAAVLVALALWRVVARRRRPGPPS